VTDMELWYRVECDGHPRVHWENGRAVIYQKMRELPPIWLPVTK